MSKSLPSAPAATVAKAESGVLFSAPAGSILPKSCRLVLPPVIHAVLGEEVSIYFKNITLAPEGKTYLFDVECAQGRQYRERWTITPEVTGGIPWKVEVRDLEDSVLASGSTVIKVARADAGAGRSIRFLGLGDSLTAAGVYTEELRTLFARPGNPALILTGSHHSEGTREGNLHEGYGGWKFIDFLEKFDPLPKPGSPVRQSSPFVFNENGHPVLDVARYVRESLKGKQPDFVFVFLGTNDLFTFCEAHRETAVKKIADHAGPGGASFFSMAKRSLIYRRSIHAFTLVELLVAIVILAVLIAIVMMSAGAIKASAHKAQCISNLRQISGGLAAYLAENNGIYPRYYGNTWAQNADGSFKRVADAPWNSILMNGGYVAEPKTLICPAACGTAPIS